MEGNSSKHNSKHNSKNSNRRSFLSSILLTVTDGLLGSMTNFILYQLFLTSSLIGATTPQRLYNAFQDADKILQEVNYKSLKNALYNLVRRGYVSREIKGGNSKFTLTQKGKDKIILLIPQFRENREWDDYLYTVSYDIPTRHNTKRDILRRFLRDIGAGLMQESLWILPFNPQKKLNMFIEKYSVEGTILVSRLERGGILGGKDIGHVIAYVYNLGELNSRYKKFIDHISKESRPSFLKASVSFHSILKSDPQLPHKLLPKSYLGDKAYELYRKKYLDNTGLSMSS